MKEDLTQQVLDFLDKSAVPSFLRETIRIALPSYSEEKKIRVLEILTEENRQYEVLDNQQDRLIEKYANILQRIKEKRHLS